MSVKKDQKPAVNSHGFLLWQAGNAWQRHVRKALSPTGMTNVQFILLDALNNLEANAEATSQARLAKVAQTDVMMTSKVLRTMEEKKWVIRKAHKSDGRSVALMLTPEGKKVLSKSRAAIEKADKEFFKNLVSKPGKFAMNLIALIESTNKDQK
ncbi:MAG: MarR family transcriptional regulator [Bacteroidia bacterium]